MTNTQVEKEAPVFTPDSANKALPYVSAVVGDVVEAFSRLRDAESTREKEIERKDASTEILRAADDAAEAARKDLVRTAAELSGAGIELKDPEIGLIDFPGMLHGRRVYLCWKHGEPKVEWWHDIEAGFRGRTRIPEEDLGLEDDA